jgi:hypothetical protein
MHLIRLLVTLYRLNLCELAGRALDDADPADSLSRPPRGEIIAKTAPPSSAGFLLCEFCWNVCDCPPLVSGDAECKKRTVPRLPSPG